MAGKYASLPDLDSSPDLYETPDLTTTPTPSTPPSPRSPLNPSAINQSRLDPSQARDIFASHTLDASDVDFSDRISTKRRAYRAGRTVGEEWEETETVEERLVRLRKEMEEVKKELEEDGEASTETEATGGEIAGLAELMDKLEGMTKRKPPTLGPLPPSTNTALTTDSHPEDSTRLESAALSATAALETRLSALETLIGVHFAPTTELTTGVTPVLPVLEKLSRQLQTLTSTSTSSLESASRKVKALLIEAEKLTDARKAATIAARRAAEEGVPVDGVLPGLTATSPDSGTPLAAPTQIISPELADPKITALYSTLSTIDSLAPVLPQVVDRLRTLKDIHRDAGRAAQGLEEVERKQEEIDGEIEKWKSAIEAAEEMVRRGEQGVEKNMQVVEGWVKGIEEKVKSLEEKV